MALGEKESESTFNEGVLQIQRLHNLWLDANRHSRQPSDHYFSEWRFTLESIWRELSRDAIRTGSSGDAEGEIGLNWEQNAWFKKYKALRMEISESETRGELYERLNEMEIFLRVLQDHVGKGSKYKNVDEDDME